MTTETHLDRLLGYLKYDPENRPLLLDATDAAIGERKPDVAQNLLQRYEALDMLPPAGMNLKGLAALQLGNFEEAEAVFSALAANTAHAPPGLAFNLAWSRAMLNDHAGALALLDDAVIADVPKAAWLKIRMLHHLGRLDEALTAGDALLARNPQNDELAAALSLVAMDAGDAECAAVFASKGQAQPEAASTLGLIALGSLDPSKAMPLFERALAQRPGLAHAWLGQGLGRMTLGDAKGSAADLDKAAELFGQHIGSWIAAGWAHYTGGNLAGARNRFDRALALDDTFAESQGSLAVVDIAEGRIDEARRRAAIAMRLDRQCFSGALAMSLLAEHDRNPQLAQKIRDRAMQVPIGANGMTIAAAMLSIGRKGTAQ